jgi:hypothetical protein
MKSDPRAHSWAMRWSKVRGQFYWVSQLEQTNAHMDNRTFFVASWWRGSGVLDVCKSALASHSQHRLHQATAKTDNLSEYILSNRQNLKLKACGGSQVVRVCVGNGCQVKARPLIEFGGSNTGVYFLLPPCSNPGVRRVMSSCFSNRRS